MQESGTLLNEQQITAVAANNIQTTSELQRKLEEPAINITVSLDLGTVMDEFSIHELFVPKIKNRKIATFTRP